MVAGACMLFLLVWNIASLSYASAYSADHRIQVIDGNVCLTTLKTVSNPSTGEVINIPIMDCDGNFELDDTPAGIAVIWGFVNIIGVGILAKSLLTIN
jgi:hypothetical protein